MGRKKFSSEFMATSGIQFITNDKGEETAVTIPIGLWRDIEAERETGYLLSSPAMRKRLTEALSRTEGISLENALEKFGI
jgi:PHD/YefM family antitoxin component YafN of YafNO toxin-antitoxin module